MNIPSPRSQNTARERQLVGQIMDAALQIPSEVADVFLYYYGHINEVVVAIHLGGWKEGQVPSEKFECYLGGVNGEVEDSLELALARVLGLLNQKV